MAGGPREHFSFRGLRQEWYYSNEKRLSQVIETLQANNPTWWKILIWISYVAGSFAIINADVFLMVVMAAIAWGLLVWDSSGETARERMQLKKVGAKERRTHWLVYCGTEVVIVAGWALAQTNKLAGLPWLVIALASWTVRAFIELPKETSGREV